jgi:hypothetical protein
MNQLLPSLTSNALIDLLIGMISVLLLASLLVTSAMEVVAQIFVLRAKMLREAIGNMLTNENNKREVKTFYNILLIKSPIKPVLIC